MKNHHMMEPWCLDVLRDRIPGWRFWPIDRKRILAAGPMHRKTFFMVINDNIIITKFIVDYDEVKKKVEKQRTGFVKPEWYDGFTTFERANRVVQ